jgi:hypothetical protein
LTGRIARTGDMEIEQALVRFQLSLYRSDIPHHVPESEDRVAVFEALAVLLLAHGLTPAAPHDHSSAASAMRRVIREWDYRKSRPEEVTTAGTAS